MAFLRADYPRSRHVKCKARWYVGYGADARPGEGIENKGMYGAPSRTTISIGTQGERLANNFWEDFMKEGGALSTVTNWIPGINAVSKLHDNIVIKYQAGTLMRDYIMNVPTMPLAAMVTYGALATDPLFQSSVGNSR